MSRDPASLCCCGSLAVRFRHEEETGYLLVSYTGPQRLALGKTFSQHFGKKFTQDCSVTKPYEADFSLSP